MNNNVVNIVIYSKETEILNDLKYAIEKECTFFKQNTQIVNDIKKVDKIENINILIVVFKNQRMNIVKNLNNKAEKLIIVDLKKGIIKGNQEKVEEITKTEDIRAIAFSIVFNYYDESRKKKFEEVQKQNDSNLDKGLNKFEGKENFKREISLKIDKALTINGRNFKGFEELKTMIMFCIINDISIKENSNDYNYIYDATAKILNETKGRMKDNITTGLAVVRHRKCKSKIGNCIIEVKTKPITEQIILIGKEIIEM